ncbi:MAG: rod shape-determining protein MreD [Treponema sp.]|nr:rod shape-determining protein MreD [Treponema sp.]MBR7080373.1 rod shape-determining protein MreD [Treponema sp.]
MILAFLLSTFILLVSTLVQAAILSNITFLPAVPDLCLICVLYFSLHNGKLFGETNGFISGLFLDFLSAGPLGLNCLMRTIIGYVGGIFNKTINTEGFFIPVLLGACATVLKVLITWLLSFLFPNSIIAYNPFTILFVFEIAINSLLTPIMFKILGLFSKTLVLKPENVL